MNRWTCLIALVFTTLFSSAETVYRRALDRVPSMDPILASSMYAGRAVQLTYEVLYEYDYAKRPYRLIPAAAEAMPEISENGKVFTIRLRPELRFHDDPCFPDGKGRPVVAQDVVFSFTRLADRRNASSGCWLTDPILGVNEFRDAQEKNPSSNPSLPGVRALDARTLRIELSYPNQQFIWFLAMPYMAIVPHEAVEKYGSDFSGHPVGSGAYRLVDWRRNHRMRYCRHPDWWGWKKGPLAISGAEDDRPFDVIQYSVIDDASTQWLCFLNGELDFLGEISRDNWDVVIDGSGRLTESLRKRGITLFSIPNMEISYIGINMRDPVLGKNKALRQALNCAFDAPAWSRFQNGRVQPADGPVPPETEGKLEEPFAYSFNLEKAKQLLVEAGYPGGKDPKTGRRLELTMDLGKTSQDMREAAELMASFYARVGIALHAQYHNWPSFLRKVAEGRSQLHRIIWVGDYPDAENFLQLFSLKKLSPGPNRTFYENPEFEKLYDAACVETDPVKRNQMWAQAQRIIREDCPWIFLNFSKSYSLTSSRVKNYIPSDFPFGSERYIRMKTVGEKGAKEP
ncbi:MAG: hypothetical protein IKR48_05725 [Kiritimatiellae bacterium]|nr:hypothetical protein [Kiritimatiellia bacterium]